MAIGAEQFPIAAVRRIVVVVAVFVVDFKQLKIAVRERARTAPAHPRIEFQRLLAITGGARLGVAAGVADDLVEFVGWLGHGVKILLWLRWRQDGVPT